MNSKIASLILAAVSFALIACAQQKEAPSQIKSPQELVEKVTLGKPVVEAVRKAAIDHKVDEEILYGLVAIETQGEHPFFKFSYPDMFNLGFRRFVSDQTAENYIPDVVPLFSRVAKELSWYYEGTERWDLALLAWGVSDVRMVKVCLGDYNPNMSISDFVTLHRNRWDAAPNGGPCLGGGEHMSANAILEIAKTHDEANVRTHGAVLKAKMDALYPTPASKE